MIINTIITNNLYIYFMERFLIFMYQFWPVALLLSFMGSVLFYFFAEDMDSHFCILPFVLTVTFYYVSMLVVRKLYQKKDEVRCRAHYLRDGFCFLTSIVWFFWVISYSLGY